MSLPTFAFETTAEEVATVFSHEIKGKNGVYQAGILPGRLELTLFQSLSPAPRSTALVLKLPALSLNTQTSLS